MAQYTTTQKSLQVVEVSRVRGPRGPVGGDGEPGDPGASLRVRGTWSSGTEYVALDAVTYRSTASSAITSLFVHRSTEDSAPVGVPPHLAPSYWSEVGLQSVGDAIGGVWTAAQPSHGITRIGTPVTVLGGNYVLASAQTLSDAAVAIVREIPDANTLILQSDGFVPRVDPGVNIAPGNAWVEGQDYWLSATAGRVQPGPTAGVVAQRVLRVIAVRGDGTADAVVVMSADLPVAPTPSPVPAASTTDVKLDNIAGAFDGVESQFPLTVSGAPVDWPAPVTSFQVFIDGHAQEAGVDFQIVETAPGSGEAAILFAEAPQDYETFWALFTLALGVASTVGIGAALPAGAAPGALWYLTAGPIGLYLFIDDGTSGQWVMVDSLGDP